MLQVQHLVRDILLILVNKRIGAEIELNGENYVNWRLSLSHVQATFEDTACIVSEVNSAAGEICGDDQIQITPGKKYQVFQKT